MSKDLAHPESTLQESSSTKPISRIQPGLLGLGLSSLPLLASLQFHIGYPLRMALTHLSKLFLVLTGRESSASGTALEWGPHLVSVKAPCSGVQMLWTSLFLVFFLAARDDWSMSLGAFALVTLGVMWSAAHRKKEASSERSSISRGRIRFLVVCFLAGRVGFVPRSGTVSTSTDEQTFTDPSAWYRAAVYGRRRGPWWSYSIAGFAGNEGTL